jgi:hypothetical protein
MAGCPELWGGRMELLLKKGVALERKAGACRVEGTN